MATEFQLLGDIEVRVNGGVVDVGHSRQRCVLAVLLIEANRVVSTAELIDRVWGEHRLPGNPRNALQTYISLLRRALTAAGDVSITRQAGGYKLTADAASIDAHCFGTLVRQARGGDDARAVALLEQALGLWRGEPVANLDTAWINSVRSTLTSQRHAAQLDLADAQLRLGQHAAVITAVSGTAGVGKTALAVHWAHQVAERFPDGQLYVNLRGYDLAKPMTANEALGGFLRALGVADRDIPADTAERAARFRSLLAGRRMLLLLDNASEGEQVRPLLPGNPACVTLVTSRSALTGLVARDGAVRLDLDLLPMGEAVDLLRTLIGPRAQAEPGLVEVLAKRCAGLPLALRVAAELAITRPAVPLADLIAELADERRRLDLLEAGGDPRTALRAVFSWSCHQLDPGPLRVFRLAGLHPGSDIDAYEVAALAGLSSGAKMNMLTSVPSDDRYKTRCVCMRTAGRANGEVPVTRVRALW